MLKKRIYLEHKPKYKQKNKDSQKQRFSIRNNLNMDEKEYEQKSGKLKYLEGSFSYRRIITDSFILFNLHFGITSIILTTGHVFHSTCINITPFTPPPSADSEIAYVHFPSTNEKLSIVNIFFEIFWTPCWYVQRRYIALCEYSWFAKLWAPTGSHGSNLRSF